LCNSKFKKLIINALIELLKSQHRAVPGIDSKPIILKTPHSKKTTGTPHGCLCIFYLVKIKAGATWTSAFETGWTFRVALKERHYFLTAVKRNKD
jgi:hypothetical protein